MNPDDQAPELGPPEAAHSRLHPALAAAMAAERARPADKASAERSMLATHHDPSLTQQAATVVTETPEAETPEAEGWRRTQVRWVRPTELIVAGGARATGWGVDLRAELLRRARESAHEHRAARAERPERSERAKRLPDLSIGGRRRTPARREVERAGMGLR